MKIFSESSTKTYRTYSQSLPVTGVGVAVVGDRTAETATMKAERRRSCMVLLVLDAGCFC